MAEMKYSRSCWLMWCGTDQPPRVVPEDGVNHISTLKVIISVTQGDLHTYNFRSGCRMRQCTQHTCSMYVFGHFGTCNIRFCHSSA